MLTTHKGEMLPLHVACLEERLRQIGHEWSHLGQWIDADQLLLTGVRSAPEQVQALLDDSSGSDSQVQRALRELLVIGHVQRFLLEQSIHRAGGERTRLQVESDQAQQAITLLRRETDPTKLM